MRFSKLAMIQLFILYICLGMGVVTVPAEASHVAIPPVPAVAVQGQVPDTLQAETQKSKKNKKARQTKERRPAVAAITSKRNITRASMMRRSAEGYKVEILLMDSGLPVRDPQDLQLIGSSGSQVSDGTRIIFENFVVPFEGMIRFKSPNKMQTVIYERVISFKINEAGHWVMNVDI